MRHTMVEGKVVGIADVGGGMACITVVAPGDRSEASHRVPVPVPVEVAAKVTLGMPFRQTVEVGASWSIDMVSRRDVIAALQRESDRHTRIIDTDGIPDRYAHREARNTLDALIREFAKETQ